MKLKEFIDKNNMTVSAFARKHNLDRQVLYRVIAGTCIMLDSAMAIIRATDGEVSIEDLLPETTPTKKTRPKKDLDK